MLGATWGSARRKNSPLVIGAFTQRPKESPLGFAPGVIGRPYRIFLAPENPRAHSRATPRLSWRQRTLARIPEPRPGGSLQGAPIRVAVGPCCQVRLGRSLFLEVAGRPRGLRGIAAAPPLDVRLAGKPLPGKGACVRGCVRARVRACVNGGEVVRGVVLRSPRACRSFWTMNPSAGQISGSSGSSPHTRSTRSYQR